MRNLLRLKETISDLVVFIVCVVRMFGWSSPLSILRKVMIRSVIRGIVEFDMCASANIGIATRSYIDM